MTTNDDILLFHFLHSNSK